ncbi:MAG: (2Fe-2S)-binding protein [Armatimonadetes bacterium]|jgi:nicotinate dehydrogenase subunit A|nr:(2Fe-2S)-binding protein [Armatimonadota bacterium]
MAQTTRFILNGKPVAVETEGARPLLWVLRGDLEHTGTKYGCGEGICGTCTVLIEGEAQRACVVPVADVAGKRVTTIEGLSQGGTLHPVQQAFVEHGAIQCGYCTPGMVLTAVALLERNPNPSEAQIRSALEANLCRCGTHQRVVAAVRAAARKLRAAS